jgi:molybdenum cofactor cytidylyltransferase
VIHDLMLSNHKSQITNRKSQMIRGLLLAAGESTRMGSPKALLPDETGRAFVTRVLHTFRAAGIADMTVVTGSLHPRIVAAVAADAPRGMVIRFARNPDPARGQLSSLLTGLDAADAPGVVAALVTLVDVPLVKPTTVRAVIEVFERTLAPIVRPVRGDEHGHPVLFASKLFVDLRNADPTIGAKAVVRTYASSIVNVEVDDEGALFDVDTPDEYERVMRS